MSRLLKYVSLIALVAILLSSLVWLKTEQFEDGNNDSWRNTVIIIAIILVCLLLAALGCYAIYHYVEYAD
jgi:branched-subunit amino acid transport protein